MGKLNIVSLFTGAGGLDYGFEAAGFRTSVAIEMDRDCSLTIEQNRGWPIISKDINQVETSEISDVSGLQRGDVDLILGGPPCQPFSKAGYWANGDTKRLKDPRASTLYAYMRCVEELLPEVFVLENVHGINYSGKEEGFEFLAKTTRRINERQGVNYRPCWQVLSAVDYGVPQQRTRFFMVAHREGRTFSFPRPTHGVGEGGQTTLFETELSPPTTAWDAIGKLPKPGEAEDLRVRGYWGDLLPSIPEGENYLWHTSRKGGLPLFGWRTRYWSFLLKLAKNRPSWTIQAQPGPAIGPFHWESRMLSAREMMAIQTFPKEIRIVGSRQSVQRQIGNAVPSLLAEVLAREVSTQLFSKKPAGKPKLRVKANKPTPPPEKVQEVPQKYLHLVGDHEDHPGEGKGNGALKRAEMSGG